MLTIDLEIQRLHALRAIQCGLMENPTYDGLSPREYLNGRNWNVQRAVGLDALRKVGVLKP
jgi:hypothetical protein